MKMYLKIIALSSLFVIIQAIVSMNTTLLNTSCNNADDSIFLEEFGKYLAIKADIGPEFLLTFNMVEFSLYYVRMAAVGIPAATIFIIRLLPGADACHGVPLGKFCLCHRRQKLRSPVD